MQITFERHPFTPWTIKITRNHEESDQNEIYANRGILGASADFEEFTAIYRSARLDGRECEQITLLPLKGSDICLIQVQIFKNGDIWTHSEIPCQVRMNRKKKQITINILATCELTKTGTLKIIPI